MSFLDKAKPLASTSTSFLAKAQMLESQKKNTLDGFSQMDQPGFIQSMAQGIAKPFLQAATTGQRLVQAAGTQLTGGKIQAPTNDPADFGYFGKVRPLGVTEEGGEASTKEQFLQGAGVTAEIGSYFVGGGAAKAGLKGLVKQGFKEGAAAGLAGGVGIGLQEKDATPESVATMGLIGTVLGGTLGAAVPAAISGTKGTYKAVKRIVSPDVEDALTRAIKPGKNNINFSKDLQLAIPEIEDTFRLKENDPSALTINEFKDAVLDTKKRVWDRYESIKSPNAHVLIDTNPIADSIESSVTPRFEMQNPAKAEAIRELAEQYRNKRMTVGEAEQFLQEANAELHSYYAKNKVGQHVAASDPETAATVREATGLRDALYAKLDELGDESSRDIKRLYGALSNIGNEVEGRAQVFNRQNPASLQETIHYPIAVAKGIMSAFRGDPIGAGESLIQVGMSRAMKESNSTDGLLRSAFTKLRKERGGFVDFGAEVGEKADNLTTKFLEYLKGKATVSRQEVMDFARRPELKKGEADLLLKKLEERPRGLLIVHNLNERKLQFSDKIGGMANPSMAVIDPKLTPFEGYGDITLIADKNLISGQKTHLADAYTARFPSVHSTMKWDDFKRLETDMKPYYDKIGKDVKKIYHDDSDMIRYIENNPAVALKFLEEQGIKPTSKGQHYYHSQIDEMKLGSQYQDFLDNLYQKYGLQEQMFAGYTPMGRRRYKTVDVETASKMMSKQKEEGFNYGLGSFRSKVAPVKKNPEALLKERGRLLNKEEFEVVKEKYNKELWSFKEELEPYAKVWDSSNNFIESDYQLNAIGGVLGGERGSWQIFKDKFPNAPQEITNKLLAFREKLKKMPTEYFETKFRRPVKINEFKIAVVPDNIGPKSQQILENNGLRVIKYAKGEKQKLLQELSNESFYGGVEPKIPAQEFADSIRRDLLELKPVKVKEPSYPNTTIDGDRFAQRPDVPKANRGKNYEEVVFESPITTNGSSHYPNSKNYFAHARGDEVVEGGKKIWREQEIQSDLLQKDQLDLQKRGVSRTEVYGAKQDITQEQAIEALNPTDRNNFRDLKSIIDEQYDGDTGWAEQNDPDLVEEFESLIAKAQEEYSKNAGRMAEIEQLSPFTNDRFGERIMRERIKEKASKGYEKYRLPTGETIGKIEGFQTGSWLNVSGHTSRDTFQLTPENLKVGNTVRQANQAASDQWIITDILGDGRFKAVRKRPLEASNDYELYQAAKDIGALNKDSAGINMDKALKDAYFRDKYAEKYSETFDLTGKSNPQYRRYSDWGKFLKNKFGGKEVTDPQGNSWMEIDLKKEMGRLPVEAFGVVPLIPSENND